ncbi:MAG TPA: hypothetical protein VKA66_21975 [Mycobacterium sp.]|nr:hypothetical protein [Mycobacterium sp.]
MSGADESAPTDRLAGLDRQERAACLIAERVLGAEATPWDVNGSQGAVDAMFLTLPGDRTAAFEVTNLAGDGALDTVGALSSGKYKWPLTGDWFWTINVRFARDLEKLNRCYPNIIRICEQAGVAHPNYQLGWSPSDHPDIRWLVQESSCDMIGHPECPAASMANPEAMVVLTASGGWIDDSMTGFAAALGAAFDGTPHIARHFKKLKNADADERHLFIPLHGTALPFSIFTVLQFDDPLPPEPPPIPDYITHLWLAPDSSKRVLIWTQPDGWRNFFPYD